VVHAGNYTVRDGKIRLWVRNPTAASVTLSAGLALAHYDLESLAGTVRLRAQLEPDLSADEILSEMRFDNAACDEDELRKRREDMRALLTSRRRALFSTERLGRCTAGEFDVQLRPEYESGEKHIPNMPPRPLPPEKQKAVEEEFDRMMRKGVRMPEPTNAYGAALVVVPKPKGGWRIAMDFRYINSAMEKQFYPLPRVLECVEKLGAARFFTARDMISAFWQIQASDRTAKLMSVNFPGHGRFRMLVMGMGMQATSATFQSIMDRVLRVARPRGFYRLLH
jgi:hypothetical protein